MNGKVLCDVIWFGFHTLHLCYRRWFQQKCHCSVVWGKLKRCQSRFLVALWALAGRYAAGEWSCRWRRWRDDACASARPGGDGEMMVVGCSHCRQPSLASFLPSISAAARFRICSLHASLWRRTQVHMWEPAWQHMWLSDSWGFLWSLRLTFGALCLFCRNAKKGETRLIREGSQVKTKPIWFEVPWRHGLICVRWENNSLSAFLWFWIVRQHLICVKGIGPGDGWAPRERSFATPCCISLVWSSRYSIWTSCHEEMANAGSRSFTE